MKTLLDFRDPRYVRRTVREINKLLRAGKSVYARHYPFNFKIKSVGFGYHGRVIAQGTDGKHEAFDTTAFYMPGIGDVSASREI